ncbi:unnamed protein product [Onchocerca flexuosa]|uniref:Uncharacterized protein n=1 Tax=Onchocerca flexuosa TaxID=387005 RepID=A0A183HAG2_9BILA|nr:unnamed protein product [Onchocerca flexuosa]
MFSNDDMIMRKIEQQAEHENFPSANNCLIPALDLVSPIGKIRQREPGPITSTPRVNATDLRGHIYRSNGLDKLSHIHEAFKIFQDIALSSNEKEPSAKLSSANDISNSSERNLHSIDRVDRSRSILSAVVAASPLELEKKEKKHGQLMVKNFHEKRKIAWGYIGQAADALEISTLKSPLADDKVPDSPMQVSTTEHINISKINSANDKSNIFKEKKKVSGLLLLFIMMLDINNCNINDMFTTSGNSKIREMQETLLENMAISTQFTISLKDEIINDDSCSSFLVEKENTPMSNEIESINVSSSLSESSICISSVNSPSEVSNNIEECVLVSLNFLTLFQLLPKNSKRLHIQLSVCVPWALQF